MLQNDLGRAVQYSYSVPHESQEIVFLSCGPMSCSAPIEEVPLYLLMGPIVMIVTIKYVLSCEI